MVKPAVAADVGETFDVTGDFAAHSHNARSTPRWLEAQRSSPGKYAPAQRAESKELPPSEVREISRLGDILLRSDGSFRTFARARVGCSAASAIFKMF